MKINSATYGNKDVLDVVNKLIVNDSLYIKVSNAIFGDPQYGIFKYLEINIDGKDYKIGENEFFVYPKTDSKKLGIFYTNNNVPNVVNYCLNDLRKFTSAADIISCVWTPIEKNTFPEIISMTKSSNHLNIVIQILQLLYFAKKNKKYDYVAFLEHDVLYPENYFDFNNFQGDAVVNMNYIGLCSQGFQHKNQNEKPLHQIVMCFQYAIYHFEKLILDAIAKGSVIVEPDNLSVRNCSNPSIHINHDRHFTSHHTIYSKTNIYKHDNYWGDSADLIKEIF